ncbi:hypothetical protein DENIS_5075 [Desulfonema ishimotonii]|uniref:Rod shape-determining protein MreD n=1 Tax=Desulfonema ishimotonii TaxID=45657 RepID=A0A401G4G1_9BACT|nr:hypothetical protein [Desulfonema ishimotonii]GBC64073.1 hypothetical protein DENIS_5075 [Desulfonema ishimotonii]
MIYWFYTFASLGLIVLQTAVIPRLPPVCHLYDLFIPFAVYLGIFGLPLEGVWVVLINGILFDSLSAAPFGVYTTTYMWLFIGVRRGLGFLDVGNYILLPLVIVSGVLLENAVLLGILISRGADGDATGQMIRIVSRQVVWAALTGPLWVMVFKVIYRNIIEKEAADVNHASP